MRYYDVESDGHGVVGMLALACCVVEAEAALARYPLLTAPPPGAPVTLVIAGTVTDAVAPLVSEAIAAHPEATVIAFGACASAGGPYWDSPVVTKGIDQLARVDLYVPGCPPTPTALLSALQEVAHAR
ncbi:MAG: proton-conducting membrane transporter [Propioniciclava sp.]